MLELMYEITGEGNKYNLYKCPCGSGEVCEVCGYGVQIRCDVCTHEYNVTGNAEKWELIKK